VKDGDTHPLTGKPYSKRFFNILKTRQKLPCYHAKEDVLNMVRNNQSSVLIGETGSGKTTQVPQFLLEAGLAGDLSIAVTQPRRVAAVSVATRVAQEFDVELGEEVGYNIRFEDMSGPLTKIKYLTDGMLLRECMADPLMSKYNVVCLDEAHERTLSNDILFGLLKEVLEKRKELRCVVMSATLEAEKFQEYWHGAPLLRVPGRMYPVETFFTLKPEKDYVQASVEVMALIHSQEGPGDILCFLCGEEEIETSAWELESRFEGDESLVVLRLYSTLPMNQQRRVFDAAPEGVRKIIIATNIAETSLTIDGVVYVVDPGVFKQKLYNPRTHVDSLLVSAISKASAMQRAGRAGRTKPGKCFRLYTQETFNKELPESTFPEIVRSNLASVVLQLKKLGVDDLVHFDFMEPPSPEAMMRALEMLHYLGALDEEADLTETGRAMVEFPLDPHLSACIISAGRRECLDEMLSIAAMLSVPSPFSRPRNQAKWADQAHKSFATGLGDHLSLLKAYSQYSDAHDKSQFCRDGYLHERSMKQAESVKRQLAGISRNLDLDKSKGGTAADGSLTVNLRKALVDGFFMQCAFIETGGKHYFTARDLQIASIHPGSFLQHRPEWVLYHETVVTDKCWMRTVTSVTPEMLIEVFPSIYHPDSGKMNDTACRSLRRALTNVKAAAAKNGKKK